MGITILEKSPVGNPRMKNGEAISVTSTQSQLILVNISLTKSLLSQDSVPEHHKHTNKN